MSSMNAVRRTSVDFQPLQEVAPKVGILLNAHAGKMRPRIAEALAEVVGKENVHFSKSELDARRLARLALEKRYETVYLGGGDGTIACFVSELVNVASHNLTSYGLRYTLPRLGLLKLGTGNALAAYLGIEEGPTSFRELAKLQSGVTPQTRTVEFLSVEGRRVPFAGLGIDGQLINDYLWVREKLLPRPLSGMMSGPATYFTSVALRTAPTCFTRGDSPSCRIINGRFASHRMNPDGSIAETFAPGDTLYRGPMMLAAAGSIPYYGFGLKMFPFAGKRTGMMNLRVGDVPAMSVVSNFRKLWRGEWFPDGIKDFLTAEATIELDREVPFQVAGDACGNRRSVTFGMSLPSFEFVDGAPPHIA